MKSTNGFPTAALALLLVLGVSCSDGSESTSLFATEIEEPAQLRVATPDPVLIKGLLTCKAQSYVVVTKAIGAKGGKIKFGNQTLDIPKDALSATVTITAEQMPGYQNTVRFKPEGLQFARSAELTMSYDKCDKVKQSKKIVYTDDLLEILQLLPGKDNGRDKTVTTALDHFSRYAVAY